VRSEGKGVGKRSAPKKNNKNTCESVSCMRGRGGACGCNMVILGCGSVCS